MEGGWVLKNFDSGLDFLNEKGLNRNINWDKKKDLF